MLLERYWDLPLAIVAKLCECLPRPHHTSYLNVRWRMHPWHWLEPWRFTTEGVLNTGLWYRYHGSYREDPASHDVIEAVMPSELTRLVMLRKSVRLVSAVMTVGINAPSFPFTDENVVDQNLALLRLLCQGPWPKTANFDEDHNRCDDVRCQLMCCFEMLVDEACFRIYAHSKDLYRRITRIDLCRLQIVFIKALEVLMWKGGPLAVGNFIPREDLNVVSFIAQAPTNAPRLGACRAEKYYIKRFFSSTL